MRQALSDAEAAAVTAGLTLEGLADRQTQLRSAAAAAGGRQEARHPGRPPGPGETCGEGGGAPAGGDAGAAAGDPVSDVDQVPRFGVLTLARHSGSRVLGLPCSW